MKKIASIILVCLLLLPTSAFATSITPVAPMPFADVPADAYYYNPVLQAIELNIIQPPYDINLYPAHDLNRYQFTYYLVRALNVDLVNPATPSFSDVSNVNDYYGMYPYIETAKKLGLVAGTQTADGKPTGKFEPFKELNRAEAAVMIMKAFMQVKRDSVAVTFPDLKNVPWAVDAIDRATAVGFFSGYPDGRFGPANTINRAEGITVVVQIHNRLESRDLTLSFAVPKIYTRDQLLKKAEAAMPKSMIVNVQQRGNFLFYFAYTKFPTRESYAWYVQFLLDENSKPKNIYDFGYASGVDQGAPSDDGTEFLLVKDDLVRVITYNLDKTPIGSNLENQISGKQRYRYPFFTPDDKYLIMQDVIDGTLVVIDAETKGIYAIDGFPSDVLGELKLEHGKDYTLYKMLSSTRVQFGTKGVVNLSTMTKE